MQKKLLVMFFGVVLAVAVAGCASAEKKSAQAALSAERILKYQHIAFVCAPAPDADPSFAQMILKQAEAMSPSRLYFLEQVDCLYDLPVDTTTSPPTLKLGEKASEYNGVVSMVYSYSGKMVNLDINMIDMTSGQSVWHHRFETEDTELKGRLIKHGYWTPTTVKQHFYHYKD